MKDAHARGRGRRPVAAALAALALAAGLPACATATIEEAVPAGALAAAPEAQPGSAFPAAPSDPAEAGAADDAAQAARSGPRDSGTFPDLNVPPGSAAEPLTPGQTAARLRALRAAQRRQAAEAGTVAGPSDAERLRTLARRHAEEALEEIEKSE